MRNLPTGSRLYTCPSMDLHPVVRHALPDMHSIMQMQCTRPIPPLLQAIFIHLHVKEVYDHTAGLGAIPDSPEERAKRQKRMARFQDAEPSESPVVVFPFISQYTHLCPLLSRLMTAQKSKTLPCMCSNCKQHLHPPSHHTAECSKCRQHSLI